MTTEELLKLKKQAENAHKKYTKLTNEILTQCHHPIEQLEDKKYHYDGDYYNTAYTEYWTECKICGKHINLTTKYHNYYG